MNGAGLLLRPFAAVWRQALVCEPDPLLLAASAGEVRAWLLGGPVPTQVLLERELAGEPYALVMAKVGEPVWVPVAALTRLDDGEVLLAAPTDALGSRLELAWQPSAPVEDGAWIQVDTDGDAVLFRREDPETGSPAGPLLRVSAFDVLGKRERLCNNDDAGAEAEAQAIDLAGARSSPARR
jgi:hypothetical protein